MKAKHPILLFLALLMAPAAERPEECVLHGACSMRPKGLYRAGQWSGPRTSTSASGRGQHRFAEVLYELASA